MKKNIIVAAITIVGLAGAVFAGGHEAADPLKTAVEARQAHMKLYAYNLGVLGAMAKGEVDYDADAASSAAANIAALGGMDQASYWMPGTSSEDIEGSRTLPALWEDFPLVMEKGMATGEAIAAMNAAAGNGVEALQAAIGPLGQACGDCHRSFRVRNN